MPVAPIVDRIRALRGRLRPIFGRTPFKLLAPFPVTLLQGARPAVAADGWGGARQSSRVQGESRGKPIRDVGDDILDAAGRKLVEFENRVQKPLEVWAEGKMQSRHRRSEATRPAAHFLSSWHCLQIRQPAARGLRIQVQHDAVRRARTRAGGHLSQHIERLNCAISFARHRSVHFPRPSPSRHGSAMPLALPSHGCCHVTAMSMPRRCHAAAVLLLYCCHTAAITLLCR